MQLFQAWKLPSSPSDLYTADKNWMIVLLGTIMKNGFEYRWDSVTMCFAVIVDAFQLSLCLS
jgi:hypothetical protein